MSFRVGLVTSYCAQETDEDHKRAGWLYTPRAPPSNSGHHTVLLTYISHIYILVPKGQRSYTYLIIVPTGISGELLAAAYPIY